MRFTTRDRPPEDSPAPGIIPGAVHVHNEPERDAHPARHPGNQRRPQAPKRGLRWKFGHGHRS